MQMKKDAICKARRQAAARYVAVTVDCLAPEDIVETVRVGPRGGAVRTLKHVTRLTKKCSPHTAASGSALPDLNTYPSL